MPAGPFSSPRSTLTSGSLQPNLPDRLIELLRPGHAQSVRARRIGAGLLVALAVLMALRGNPGTERTSVVVAVRDLAPGHTLTAEDVSIEEREAVSVAPGTLIEIDDAVGHTLAAPTVAGEPLVDVRMLGPRLSAAATGTPDARAVPIRLADAGVGDLLREGDLVDVLTIGDDADARVLARGAVVVLAEQSAGPDRGDRVVLVALEPDQATAVAAASLVSALTVTLH